MQHHICPECGSGRILAYVDVTQEVSGTREAVAKYELDPDGEPSSQYDVHETEDEVDVSETHSEDINGVQYYECNSCGEENTDLAYFIDEDSDGVKKSDTDDDGFSISAIKELVKDD